MSKFAHKLATMPDETRRYLLADLPAHLSHANESGKLHTLLTTFAFLQAKVDELGNPQLLIEDYDLMDDEVLSLIQQALRLSVHIVQSDKTQLFGQLHARLLTHLDENTGITDFLLAAQDELPYSSLITIRPSLPQVGGSLVRTLSGHVAEVNKVVVTPTGQEIVSASEDQTIKVWRLSDGSLLRTLQGHTAGINSLAILSDGVRLLSASSDNTIRLWNIHTGAMLNEFKGHLNSVTDVLVVADEQMAVSTSQDNTLKVWDLETFELVRSIDLGVTCAKLLPSDKPNEIITVVGSEPRKRMSHQSYHALEIWNFATGEKLDKISAIDPNYTSLTTFTPDAKFAISANAMNFQFLWDIASGEQLIAIHNHKDAITCSVSTTDGRFVLSGSRDRSIKVWDLSTRKTPQQVPALRGHTDSIWDLALTPDDKYLISASKDMTINVWDFRKEKPELFQEHMLDYAPALSRSRNHAIPEPSHWSAISAIAVHRDVKQLFTASFDERTKQWDLVEGREVSDFLWDDGAVNAVVVLPDGEHILTASSGKTLKKWNIQGRKVVKSLAGHRDSVDDLALVPNRPWIISASADNTLRIWDYSSYDVIASLGGHTDKVRCVTVTRDGQFALSGSADRSIKIWDLTTHAVVRTINAHTGAIFALCVTSDNQYIISGEGDKSIKVRDFASGQLIQELRLHTAIVSALSLSDDNRYLVSVSHDKTCRLWDTNTWHCIATFSTPDALYTGIFIDKASIACAGQNAQIYLLRILLAEDKPLEESLLSVNPVPLLTLPKGIRLNQNKVMAAMAQAQRPAPRVYKAAQSQKPSQGSTNRTTSNTNNPFSVKIEIPSAKNEYGIPKIMPPTGRALVVTTPRGIDSNTPEGRLITDLGMAMQISDIAARNYISEIRKKALSKIRIDVFVNYLELFLDDHQKKRHFPKEVPGALPDLKVLDTVQAFIDELKKTSQSPVRVQNVVITVQPQIKQVPAGKAIPINSKIDQRSPEGRLILSLAQIIPLGGNLLGRRIELQRQGLSQYNKAKLLDYLLLFIDDEQAKRGPDRISDIAMTQLKAFLHAVANYYDKPPTVVIQNKQTRIWIQVNGAIDLNTTEGKIIRELAESSAANGQGIQGIIAKHIRQLASYDLPVLNRYLGLFVNDQKSARSPWRPTNATIYELEKFLKAVSTHPTNNKRGP